MEVERMSIVYKNLKIEEIYRKKETGRYVLPVQCSYCAYVKTCWEGRYEVEIKGGKPKLYRK